VWNKDDEYSYTEWKQLVTPTLALLQYNLEEIENGTASLTLERDQLLLARIVESLVHAKAALAHAKQGRGSSSGTEAILNLKAMYGTTMKGVTSVLAFNACVADFPNAEEEDSFEDYMGHLLERHDQIKYSEVTIEQLLKVRVLDEIGEGSPLHSLALKYRLPMNATISFRDMLTELQEAYNAVVRSQKKSANIAKTKIADCQKQHVARDIETSYLAQLQALQAQVNSLQADPSRNNNSSRNNTNCFRCGAKHNASNCWAKDLECNYCFNKGHIQRVCRKRKADLAAGNNPNDVAGKYLSYPTTNPTPTPTDMSGCDTRRPVVGQKLRVRRGSRKLGKTVPVAKVTPAPGKGLQSLGETLGEPKIGAVVPPSENPVGDLGLGNGQTVGSEKSKKITARGSSFVKQTDADRSARLREKVRAGYTALGALETAARGAAVIDSGCSMSTSPRLDIMTDVRPTRVVYETANGDETSRGRGNIHTKATTTDGKLFEIVVEGHCLPKSNRVLLSMDQLLAAGYTFTPDMGLLITPTNEWIQLTRESGVLQFAKRVQNGQQTSIVEKNGQKEREHGQQTSIIEKNGKKEREHGYVALTPREMHVRLGHVGVSRLKTICAGSKLSMVTQPESTGCISCQQGAGVKTKMTKGPNVANQVSSAGLVVATDFTGVKVRSRRGNKYGIIFICAGTKFRRGYPLPKANSSGATKAFDLFRGELLRYSLRGNPKMRDCLILVDGDTAYLGKNSKFQKRVTELGYTVKVCAPDEHQTHGLAETTIGSTMRGVSTIIHDSNLSPLDWDYALTYKTMNDNFIKLSNSQPAPYTQLSGRTKDLRGLHRFGCLMLKHIPVHKQVKKGFTSKVQVGIFYGYCPQSTYGTYLMYNLHTREMNRTRSAQFYDHILPKRTDTPMKWVTALRQEYNDNLSHPNFSFFTDLEDKRQPVHPDVAEGGAGETVGSARANNDDDIDPVSMNVQAVAEESPATADAEVMYESDSSGNTEAKEGDCSDEGGTASDISGTNAHDADTEGSTQGSFYNEGSSENFCSVSTENILHHGRREVGAVTTVKHNRDNNTSKFLATLATKYSQDDPETWVWERNKPAYRPGDRVYHPDEDGSLGLLIRVPTSEKSLSKLTRYEQMLWRRCMEAEIIGLKAQGVFEEVPSIPQGFQAIRGFWIYTLKNRDENGLRRLKARFVANGKEQDVTDIADQLEAPTATITLIKAQLLKALTKGHHIMSSDITLAFLRSNCTQEIYLKLSSQKFRLNKMLYGLRNSPNSWWKLITEKLAGFGLVPSKHDPCLFVDTIKKRDLTLNLWVDDLLVTGPEASCVKLQAYLETIFGGKDEVTTHHWPKKGRATFVGLEFNLDEIGGRTQVTITQTEYIEKLVTSLKLEQSKPVRNPSLGASNMGHTMLRLPTKDEVVYNPQYRVIVGKLLYTLHTRPELSFHIGQLCKYNNVHGDIHWRAVLQVVKYLKTTKNRGLTLVGADCMKNLILSGVTDASYNPDVDKRRSVTGMMIVLGTSVIAHKSKTQTFTSLSSCEAEVEAIFFLAKQLVFLRNVLSDMGIVDKNQPTSVFTDSQSAMKLLQRQYPGSNSKHMSTRFHWTKDQIDASRMELKYQPTDELVADIATKYLGNNKFKYLGDKVQNGNVVFPKV